MGCNLADRGQDDPDGTQEGVCSTSFLVILSTSTFKRLSSRYVWSKLNPETLYRINEMKRIYNILCLLYDYNIPDLAKIPF